MFLFTETNSHYSERYRSLWVPPLILRLPPTPSPSVRLTRCSSSPPSPPRRLTRRRLGGSGRSPSKMARRRRRGASGRRCEGRLLAPDRILPIRYLKRTEKGRIGGLPLHSCHHFNLQASFAGIDSGIDLQTQFILSYDLLNMAFIKRAMMARLLHILKPWLTNYNSHVHTSF